MSKCLKKLFALVISLAILIACIPTFSVFAETQSGTCGENVTWSLDTESGILTISGSGDMYCYSFSPEPWYSQRSSIKSVNIEDGVTSISDSAFYYCNSLISVTIPDSVTSIGYSAFRGCSSLTSITIPDSVTSIGGSAFYGCNNLTIRCCENSIAHNYAIENNIPYTLINGDVTIGDANGDGRINNKDLSLLMQYINGWVVEIDDTVADVNADGRVNTKDYGLLMQYVNGWEVVLG
ncbi:MAG: leucine-rich repeat protein [Acutalibacteraceae bacterium]